MDEQLIMQFAIENHFQSGILALVVIILMAAITVEAAAY
jgi:hypothetical protein